MQSGIDCLYSRGNVWSPVMSAVKANSPLPKDNGDSEFNWCRVGLCLSTRALRLISAAALAREPAKRLAPRANAAVPMAVARKSLRETLISATVRTPLACQFLTGRLERKRPRLHSRATNLTNNRGRLRSRLCGQRPRVFGSTPEAFVPLRYRINAEAVQSRGD